MSPISMAKKKKGGLSRFLGAITGSPYERLQKQIEKMVAESSSDKSLAKSIEKMVKLIANQYEEGNIDEEEHDLLVEEVEEVDPKGRMFSKLEEDEDAFYGEEMPDSPDLKIGKTINLDELMTTRGDSFTGSHGRDEFDEFRQRMASEFMSEAGDNYVQDDRHKRMQNRSFVDEDEELRQMKEKLVQETGMHDPNAEEQGDDPDHYFDEDDVEWWRDETGTWWYRMPGEEDWEEFFE